MQSCYNAGVTELENEAINSTFPCLNGRPCTVNNCKHIGLHFLNIGQHMHKVLLIQSAVWYVAKSLSIE